jgi:AraC-like DNA-binding protein
MEVPDLISTPERTIVDFKKYGLDDISRLGKYVYKSAHGQLEKHVHEGMMEICYCDKGVQVYEVAGKKYQIKGGDVFVTFPGEPHSSDKYPEEKGALYWLIIKIPAREQFLNYSKEDSKAFIKELLSLPVRHFRGNATMKKELDEMFRLHSTAQQPMHRLRMINLLTNFLLLVIQGAGRNTQKIHSDRVIAVKQYITAHLYDDLSIEQLAKKLHLSDAHFKSWFKKEIGMPPLDYILRERIDEAKRIMLRNRDLNMTEIAYQLNFSSSQYFATVFKKYAGISPALFRNEQQANEAP